MFNLMQVVELSFDKKQERRSKGQEAREKKQGARNKKQEGEREFIVWIVHFLTG